MKRLLLIAAVVAAALPSTAHAHDRVETWEQFRDRHVDAQVAIFGEPWLIENHSKLLQDLEDRWNDLHPPTWATLSGTPPEYIADCESGGDYLAENDVSTASGKWQIVDGTWDGYGGYSHASDAPPAVQDAKAAELWDGGNGASHWAACL